jgi:hypothetical protein
MIRAHEQVVLILSGFGLKAATTLQQVMQMA